MTNAKNTKKALLLSALSLLVCFSMLLGTTFAWFTDSVISANNIITSGTLDVGMYWADGTKAVPTTDEAWTDASEGAIFNYDLWEPGYVEVRHIKIANEGSLALKYKVQIIANGEVSELADVIDVYYIDPAVQVADRAALTEANKIGTLTEVLAGLDISGNGTLEAGTADTITIALKMQETAGNEYQNKSIGASFSIQLLATQATVESDDFDDQYDADAEFAEINNATKEENQPADVKVGDVIVQVPAGAPAGNYAVEVSNKNETTDAEGNTTISMDIVLKKDGEKVTSDGTTVYTVSVDVGTYKTIGAITHNGEAVTNYNYDPFTGIISFETTSFSPFTFTYVDAPVNSAVLIASQGNAYYYSTLADAVNAAKDGDTLTLLKDIDLGTERVTIKGKELTINLNEKTITSANERTIMVDLLRVNNADKRGVLTLTGNGTVKNTQNNESYGFAVYVGGSSDLIVNEGVTVESVYGKAVILAPMGLDNGAARYSTLNVNGGCITGRYAITGYGSARDTYITVNVNSGIVYGRDVAIYQPQFGDVTVNGGTVTGGGEAAIAMRSGNLTVNGGTVNGIIDILGDHHVSNKEDAYSTATFNGGNFDNATIKYSVGNGNVIFKADDVEAIAPDGYKWTDDGSIVACTYVVAIGKVKFDSIGAAVAYARAKNITDLELTLITKDNTKASAIELDDSLYLYCERVFNSITVKQDDASKVYYIAGIYTGSRTNNGKFVFDGVNIHVFDQYIFEGNVDLVNNSLITSSAEANCFIYGSVTTIEPGSKIKGVIEDFRGGKMYIDGGNTDGTYSAEPGVQDSIMHIRWSGDKLILKNGAYVKINAVNEVGRMNLSDGTAVELTASKLDVWEYIDIAASAQIKTDLASVITTNKITGSGKIYIDATAFDGTEVQVINANMSGFTGTVEVTGDATYEIVANGIIVKAVAEQ